MKKLLASAICLFALTLHAQTTSSLVGAVTDPSGGAVVNAKVSARNLETNAVKDIMTDETGRYRVSQLVPGSYELTVESAGFQKFVQRPITIRLNQDSDVAVQLKVGAVSDVVTITGDAALINTTNAEIGVNFDNARITNLPLAPNRNIMNLALSVAGVSQLSSGNSSFADGGVSFSVNGNRTRSNNFMLDGGDMNQPSVGGATQQINNQDTVAEFQLITNQFRPEYGRASGSVVNVITKSGSNDFHGSAYWFNNNNKLNALSNIEKQAGFTKAPYRIENQFAGTFGGAIKKDRTFFFVSALRWTDRALGTGASIGGAPTQAGKDLINQLAGSRPQVKQLLDLLPAAQTATGATAPLTVGDRTVAVPLGILGGAAPNLLNAWQWSVRGDHRFSDKLNMFSRYQSDTRETIGGQAVPPGITSYAPTTRHVAITSFNYSITPTVFSETRLAFNRQDTSTVGTDARQSAIPSIEISQFGMTGFNAANTRTALGLSVNFPQSATYNNYQLVQNIAMQRGTHAYKFGIDFRRQNQHTIFNPTGRGRLGYNTLQDFVEDLAQDATINAPLPGVPEKQHYVYYDYFFFVQDEWRIKPNFTLTYGIRYETPGNALHLLQTLNDDVLRLNNNNPAFRVDPLPGRDKNNWAPRVGFNYRLGTAPGMLKFLTGDGKLVMRGGYSRSYDIIFNNMALNVFSSFPFVVVAQPPLTTRPGSNTSFFANGYQFIDEIRTGRRTPSVANPNLIQRTIVDSTFRAPFSEQYSMQLQRELSSRWALSVGYVATKGTALFQSLDGNPTIPGSGGRTRLDGNRGIIRHRANSSSSIYHSLQTSLEKRLSQNFSMAAHYTWSSFIDDASEVFNASTAGEVAVPQDSFNRRAERGRSTYDRPHRFTVNGVWEIPFMRDQKGVAGRVLGGWQLSSFLTFQAGNPFSVLWGADPGNRLTGISGLIGTAIRPNLNTNLDLASLGVREIRAAGGGSLFANPVTSGGIGNLGRNVLRSDGINNLDLAVIKSVKMPWEGHALAIRMELYNTTNTRDYGIPEARATASASSFLNEGLTDGGKRRIVMGLRYSF